MAPLGTSLGEDTCAVGVSRGIGLGDRGQIGVLTARHIVESLLEPASSDSAGATCQVVPGCRSRPRFCAGFVWAQRDRGIWPFLVVSEQQE